MGIANEEDSETWVLAPSASVVNVRSMWTWIYPFIAFDDLPFYNLLDTMNTALDWSSPLSINHGCAKPLRSNAQHKNVTNAVQVWQCSVSISLISQKPPPLMACDSHVGDSKFPSQIIPRYILGSPNSSIIEQHNLALSSQVNNTGGIFSLKYLFNDPGGWAWANSSLREHHWLSQGSLIGPNDNSHQHL